MDYERELKEAILATAVAGRIACDEYRCFVEIPDAPASISTHVDRACQEVILNHLREQFPRDGYLAEEGSASHVDNPHGSDRLWIVDPIDGTRGFVRKLGEFSIMVGLAVKGKPVVGLVLEPICDRLTYATANNGCWVRRGGAAAIRCHTSRRKVLSDAVVVQSWRTPGESLKPVVQAIKPSKIIETYSAGIKLAMVARGEADLYVNDYRGFKDWDVCAGHVLVEEAGGRLTDFGGGTIYYGQGDSTARQGFIASNGVMHAEVQGLVNSMN